MALAALVVAVVHAVTHVATARVTIPAACVAAASATLALASPASPADRGPACARRPRVRAAAVLVAVVAVAAGVRAAHADRALRDVVLGPWAGPARLVDEPADARGAVRVVLEIEGDRFVATTRGAAANLLRRRAAGQTLHVVGERAPLGPAEAARWRARHVQGTLRIARVAEPAAPAPPYARAATRARELVRAGAAGLAPDDRALLLALLMGDDRAQPPSMVAAFRASGLSHLSAVSGQNVAFLLAAAAPLLRRLAPAVRLGATLVLLAWFVVVTRIEPSVVRAAAMAAITAVALALGHRPSALRVLALCVAGVVLADPMLVHSVGFALSVAATAGLSVLAAPIARRLPGPRWLASLAAASIAAQVGVAPVQLAIFGPPPCTALAANVLAVPVASLVMLVGLPVTLVLGLVAPLAASAAPLAGPLAAPFALAGDLALFPLRIGVRWIWWVAEIGAAVSARAC